jgi:hypothetical protein
MAADADAIKTALDIFNNSINNGLHHDVFKSYLFLQMVSLVILEVILE